jgi:hypothetical protein
MLRKDKICDSGPDQFASQKQRLKLYIIIPVYNAQSTVASVVDQVCGVRIRLSHKIVNVSFGLCLSRG